LPQWRKFWFEDSENQLLVRVASDDGGPRITHFLLLGHDIRTADLQEIPLGRIIQMINAGATEGEVVQAASTTRGIDKFTNYESFVTIADLKPEPEPEGVPWTPSGDRQLLTRPGHGPGRDVDAFYQSVADAYREHIIRTSRVAPAIAAEADVPVGTARTWIREARTRGFLEQPKRLTRVGKRKP
jgi:hypothetical protein